MGTNETAGDTISSPTLKKDWRFYAGLAAMASAVVMPLAAIFVPLLGLSTTHSAVLVGTMVAGGPEVLCILAVVLLGKDTFNYFVQLAKRTLRRAVVDRPASKLRYSVGLVIVIVSWIPAYLYAYLPGFFPSGDTRIYILAGMDLAFIVSVFLMGGEF